MSLPRISHALFKTTPQTVISKNNVLAYGKRFSTNLPMDKKKMDPREVVGVIFGGYIATCSLYQGFKTSERGCRLPSFVGGACLGAIWGTYKLVEVPIRFVDTVEDAIGGPQVVSQQSHGLQNRNTSHGKN